jgi:hypothetical protein
MNRTSKRISEYPFQPARRNIGRFPQREHRSPNDPKFRAGLLYLGQEEILIDSKTPRSIFYRAVAVWPN